MHKIQMLSYKVFISLAVCTTSFAQYIDFGTRGETFEITDRSFNSLFNERMKKLDRKGLFNNAKKILDESLIVSNNSLPSCKKTTNRRYTPTFKLTRDIVLPITGETIKKAGTYNLLKELSKPLNKYSFFINLDKKEEFKMAKMYAKKNSSKIYFFIVSGNMKKLLKKNNTVFKADKEILKIFNINCTPSIAVQSNNSLNISQYRLRKETK